MACFSSVTCLRFQLPLNPPTNIKINQLRRRSPSVKFGLSKNGLPVPRTSHLRISCVAKAETVDKVCSVVRKQLALPAESELTPESKFLALGADSLDLVEIIMALEEEFGINIEEDNAQNITTVQEAADLIEDIIVKPQS